MMQQTKPANKWQIFFLVAVGIFMCTLDGSIVNIALPVIMDDMATSLAAVEWVVLIYLLTVTSLLLSFGRLSDIKGRRWVYTRGLFLFAAGSLLCSISQNVSGLVVSRFFQGIGAAMVMACTPAIIVDTFDISERGRALGMMGAVVAGGLTIGPALGGSMTHFFSWRSIFYINIPIGVLAAFFVNRSLKGSPADTSRPETFDWGGAVLLTCCLGTVLLMLSHGSQWGWTATRTLLLLTASVCAAIGLFVLETRIQHPILAPALLRVRLYTLPLLSATLMFAALFTLVFLLPFYLLNPGGFPANRAGWIMVALFISLFFVSPISGSLSDKIGSRLLCTLGMAILALSFFLILGLPPQPSPLSVAWRLVLAGVGTAVFLSPNSATTLNAVPPQYRGLAASTVAAARNLGMVLGVAMAGAVFNSSFLRITGEASMKAYKPQLENAFMSAFGDAILAGGVVAVIGMVVAFLRGPDAK